MSKLNASEMPNSDGYFGEYGGSFVPPELQDVLDEITREYLAIKDDPEFFVVMVFPDASECTKFLSDRGLPTDQRYISADNLIFSIRGHKI